MKLAAQYYILLIECHWQGIQPMDDSFPRALLSGFIIKKKGRAWSNQRPAVLVSISGFSF